MTNHKLAMTFALISVFFAGCGGGGGSDVNQPTNRAPIAQNVSIETNEDAPVSGQLVATDADGDPISFQLVNASSAPHKGTLTLSNTSTGEFQFVPNLGEFGPDRFTYRVNDGQTNSSDATLTININARPRIDDMSVVTVADEVVNAVPNMSDADSSQLTVSLDTLPTNGTAAITDSATGAFEYQPNLGFTGTDQFTITASDASARSMPGIISVDVSARPVLTFELDASIGNESQLEQIKVLVDPPSPLASSVELIVGGTATAGVDYQSPTRPLVIAAGLTEVPIPLSVLIDDQTESGETVELTLASPCTACDIGGTQLKHQVALDDWRGMRKFTDLISDVGFEMQGESLADDSSIGPVVGGGSAIMQLDLRGEVVWATEIAPNGARVDRVRDVQRTSDGSIYATGDVFLGSGFSDVFVCKLSSNGTVEWVDTFGTEFEEVAHSIAIDSEGAVYVAGRTSGDLAGPSFGGIDFFLSRHLGDGTLDWIQQKGTIGDDALTYVPVAVTGTGSIVTFADMPSVATDVIGFDSSGNELWRTGVSESADAWVSDLHPASDDNFIATGASGAALEPGQGSGPFVVQFNAVGSRNWTSQMEDDPSNSPYILDSAVGPDGSIWLAGHTFGDLLGDGNQGVVDIVVLRFAPDGSLLLVQEAGSALSDQGLGIGVDGDGSAYVLISSGGDLLEFAAGTPSQGIFKTSIEGIIH